MSGFNPVFQSISQGPNGSFTLTLGAGAFHATYNWEETYSWTACYNIPMGGSYCDPPVNKDAKFDYAPGFGGLSVTVPLQFTYNSGAWSINIGTSTGTSYNPSANIPSKSILQDQDVGCFTSHVDDATASAVAEIDFQTLIQQVLPPLIESIPASGHLTPDIVYTFGLGDFGLAFPNNAGIQIGATGTVTWKGNSYPGTPPKGLPVPPVPTGQHHLQMYVSNYEFDALYWAFFKDDGLTAIVQPSDLPDPSILQVNTYTTAIPAFKPYSGKAMQALVQPSVAPTTSFQEVWVLSAPVMKILQSQLPSNVFGDLQGISGNAYVTQASFESDLTAAGVATTYFATIETAAKAMGAAVQQTIEFTITIEGTNINPPPNLVFTVTRNDVLQNLGLGLAGNAQTLQFAFTKSSATAAFVSTNIPNFDKQDFGDLLWPVAGEPRYDQLLQDMGKKGVPLPIMQGFQFDFDQAVLSIQQGYVSVLADVKLKS